MRKVRFSGTAGKETIKGLINGMYLKARGNQILFFGN